MDHPRRQFYTAASRFEIAPPTAGKPTTLIGYACVWDAISSDRGGYKVRLRPGSASFAPLTHALYHHDYRDLLGSTANGSLRLSSDATGVRCEIDLPDTSAGRDVGVLVRDGYVAGMSFYMASIERSRETTEAGQAILDVEAFTLDEVTITAIPAFKETTITVQPTTTPAPFAARITDRLRFERARFDLTKVAGAKTPTRVAV